MSFFRLLLANLWYHWRGNLAVLLGVVVGTAVLTGALLVGDSLRGSLRELTLSQLGWVDMALLGDRFFRQELAEKLAAERVAPVILLQTTAVRLDQDNQPAGRHVRQVVLLGVDGRFWTGEPSKTEPQELGGVAAEFWTPPPEQPIDLQARSVVLNAALAHDLDVQVGDRVSFTLEKVSTTPRESVLGRRETKDVVAALPLLVKAIVPMDHFGGRFNLNPRPTVPRNAYVPLRVLQEELRAQQRERTLPYAPINGILVAGAQPETVQMDLKQHITLEDWGLELRKPRKKFGIPAPKYLSLESHELFIPPVVQQAVAKCDLTTAPTLVYLVNNMTSLRRQLATVAASLTPPGAELSRPAIAYYGPVEVPYCVVAGLELHRKPPLGPFIPEDMKLADDEILVVFWDESPLTGVERGGWVTLSYFEPASEGQLREQQARFRVAGYLSLKGPANDPYLTPQFPGITDRLTLADWDPPFPFDKTRIRERDEEYWSKHRTTPKAYITLAAAQKLWGSRYGEVTSIRIVPTGDHPQQFIAQEILHHLEPSEGGFRFDAVRASALAASSSGMDFGLLFLGFSFFLILAALLLVGLLFRLNIDRRASEIGLLLAVGLPRRLVRRLLLAEGTLLALIGGLMGLGVAIIYAYFLLDYLRQNWPGQVNLAFLQLHVTPVSLVIGYVSAVLVSVLTIVWAVRMLGKVSPRELIAGQTTSAASDVHPRRFFWNTLVLLVGVVGAIICFVLGGRVQDHEMQAMSFLGSGMLLLAAGLALVWRLMVSGRQQDVTRGGWSGLARLGMRNAGRHPVRSLLTMGLLASATFLIVAVQAFHRNATADFLDKYGGSGGFPLLAEADVPIYLDLNNPQVWPELEHDRGGKAKNQLDELRKLRFAPFRVKQGDDASCLNLYKPGEPKIMGVPNSIIQRGGFRFAGTEADTEAEHANPWLLLDQVRDDGAIPVFGEANSVMWMLKSGLGGEIEVRDGRGEKVKLRIVGLLRDSVFQSGLLMSEQHFRRLYPREEGYRFFLIDVPPALAPHAGGGEPFLSPRPGTPGRGAGGEGEIIPALETTLAAYGVAVTPAAERLEAYLAVENTYLSTFQALGGLGLLLGVLGLAVVLLRSIWERRGELALLRALGFRTSALNWLVLAENAYLLTLGLLVGTVAALISVAPHVFSGAEVPWLQLGGLLLLVLIIGLLAALLALLSALRAPLIPALRRE